ncbi:hypothetical protein G6K88_21985 [Agrobacterium rhizogenes]|uniref:hypothetical protein n=1 Tax=Rhizobium rhizogenes TaxID=359 RepID=UPI0015727CAE|nr:hypothetical protein [Rhizobium rhizogenes]NTH66575.1 hypothetical protein [Rhizobium rhizogenes]NTI04697.1 hypothetical protein [Rhizobium rhizogenes]NTI11506.1 hypothetical protein [Rhizobium rhizogenes]
MTAQKPKKETAPDEVADDAKPKTCFVMMPISDVDGYPSGHFDEVYKQLIVPAVTAAGYECELATSTNSAHMIQLEVVTKVATADLCICDLSTNNPNVLFEYGIRQAFDKPTVLIKDDKTRRLFDLSGFRDIEYDHSLRIAKTLETRTLIGRSIVDTVNGSKDGSQVFSLVKLMQLTKAALPTGQIDTQDARFALLNEKLDRLARSISPPPPPRPPELDLLNNALAPGIGLRKNGDPPLKIHLDDGILSILTLDGSLLDAFPLEQVDLRNIAQKFGDTTAVRVHGMIGSKKANDL